MSSVDQLAALVAGIDDLRGRVEHLRATDGPESGLVRDVLTSTEGRLRDIRADLVFVAHDRQAAIHVVGLAS